MMPGDEIIKLGSYRAEKAEKSAPHVVCIANDRSICLEWLDLESAVGKPLESPVMRTSRWAMNTDLPNFVRFTQEGLIIHANDDYHGCKREQKYEGNNKSWGY